ncbi:hypothetical protein [Chondrinema litorale]|uniref:hypothetical protein n=1 Tax=Chondrinema litorale TaxID=2994555 RepID=UPI002542CD5C|nr:hypothetical protein [Chondrinema litorale]UZR92940.1 hypothetical protein OQ292_13845 [Chondrinema litorale]
MRKLTIIGTTGLFITLLITSCKVDIKSDMDVEKVKSEIDSHKIKHFTDSQITQAAYDFGNKYLSEKKFQTVSCNSSLIKESSKDDIINDCILICNDSLISNNKERMIWDAYTNSFKNGASLSDNIQEIDDSYFLYTTPLTSLTKINTDSTKALKVVFVRINKKELIKKM